VNFRPRERPLRMRVEGVYVESITWIPVVGVCQVRFLTGEERRVYEV